jgi:hypothetical protein
MIKPGDIAHPDGVPLQQRTDPAGDLEQVIVGL